jgi:hypothetical protein
MLNRGYRAIIITTIITFIMGAVIYQRNYHWFGCHWQEWGLGWRSG